MYKITVRSILVEHGIKTPKDVLNKPKTNKDGLNWGRLDNYCMDELNFT